MFGRVIRALIVGLLSLYFLVFFTILLIGPAHLPIDHFRVAGRFEAIQMRSYLPGDTASRTTCLTLRDADGWSILTHETGDSSKEEGVSTFCVRGPVVGEFPEKGTLVEAADWTGYADGLQIKDAAGGRVYKLNFQPVLWRYRIFKGTCQLIDQDEVLALDKEEVWQIRIRPVSMMHQSLGYDLWRVGVDPEPTACK